MDWSFRYERTLSFYSTSISVLQFSTDFTKLISGNGSGDVKVWDVSQWSELATLRHGDGKNAVPRCVGVSPTGALACCHPNVICVYNAKYELELELKPPQDLGATTWRCMCFSPTRAVDEDAGEVGEDNLLVAWTETSLCVYPVTSTSLQPRLTRSVVHSSAAPRVCTFTRCGTHAVCGHADGQIYVWNASSFSLERTLVGHLNAITSLDFSISSEICPSMLVTCSQDRTLRVWDGKERGWQLAYYLSVSVVHDHQAIRSCQFSKDGTFFVTCGTELVVWKWLPESQRTEGGRPPLVPHQKLQGCMNGMRLKAVVAGGSQIVVGSVEGVLGVWSVAQEAPPVQEQLTKNKEVTKESNDQKVVESPPKCPDMKKPECSSPKNGKIGAKAQPCSVKSGRRQSQRVQMYKVSESPVKIVECHSMRKIESATHLGAGTSTPSTSCTPTPTLPNAVPSYCSTPTTASRMVKSPSLPAMPFLQRNSTTPLNTSSNRLSTGSCQVVPRQNLGLMRRVTLEPVIIS